MDKATSSGLTAEDMKVSMKKARNKALASFTGPTVAATKDSGRMENKTAGDSLSAKRDKKKQEYGVTVRTSDGSTD